MAQDYVQAVEWFGKAADQFDADAQLNLGIAYFSGRGVPQDDAQGVWWTRKAVEQGHANAQHNLGIAYGTGRGVPQDDAQAVSWFRQAAEQGHADAQFLLGEAYETGEGVAQDFAQAVSWYRPAADQGHASAQRYLGYAYNSGQGVQKDDVEAVTWYRKAADQGDVGAQFLLGLAYADANSVPQDFVAVADANGVPQDLVEAHKWVSLAVSGGDARGGEVRDALEKEMTPAQLADAQQRASEWQAAFDLASGAAVQTTPATELETALSQIQIAAGKLPSVIEEGRLDYSEEPSYTTQSVEQRFYETRASLGMVSGGGEYFTGVSHVGRRPAVDVSYLGGDCTGYAAVAPDYRLHWTGNSSELEISFSATDGGDPTLLVNLPDGSWACNDDADGSDPMLVFETPEAGQYDVWVGSYSAGDGGPGVLVVTGQPGAGNR